MWSFWIDRGGTFTDIVAQPPSSFSRAKSEVLPPNIARFGDLLYIKLLSESGDYSDAALEGIARLMRLAENKGEVGSKISRSRIPYIIPCEEIRSIKMGTTIATNALLERKGEETVFLTAKGFKDLLVIGYQNRPHIFARNIQRAPPLYSLVLEIDARIDAQGRSVKKLDEGEVARKLKSAFERGLRSLAIALPHAYLYPRDEKRVAAIAREMGYTQISTSYEVAPLIKLVSRADTTVLDAYLSPVVKGYVDKLELALGAREASRQAAREGEGQRQQQEKLNRLLLFMQSNGGLVASQHFRGKDAVLSGPAGGVVGMVKTASLAKGQKNKLKLIGFDMGGTSSDVSHYDGEYERRFETMIDGVRLRTPMMNIRTIAAGGGSILNFDGLRMRVGPDSAGANPGPACYGRGGPLTLTDCNLLIGKIQPQYFPKQFGKDAKQALEIKIVKQKFRKLIASIVRERPSAAKISAESVALGFIEIAVDSMANAIKEISVQRGYDVTDYTLQCFGGASGQHACAVADKLGITRIFMHPLAGLLSAYGIGLAEQRCLREAQVDKDFNRHDSMAIISNVCADLQKEASRQLLPYLAADEKLAVTSKVRLRSRGSDSTIEVAVATGRSVPRRSVPRRSVPRRSMLRDYRKKYQRIYGFPARALDALIISSVSVEVFAYKAAVRANAWASVTKSVTKSIAKIIESGFSRRQANFISQCISHATSCASVDIYIGSAWQSCPLYKREDLPRGRVILGPAIITEPASTIVIEPQWQGLLDEKDNLILTRVQVKKKRTLANNTHNINTLASSDEVADPIMLEIFANLFKSIAEQMGASLQNTAHSVNIKERLDFSCALFDSSGALVANAPHIPVHLGSMSEAIKAVIAKHAKTMREGNVYILNSPYDGGTHLPDITVVKPFFVANNRRASFYLASRGHHADVGGISPGSAPANAKHIEEEGVLLDNVLLLARKKFREKEIRALLLSGKYPARNVETNIADLRAQVAANETGARALAAAIDNFSYARIERYARYVQQQGEECVRRIIDKLPRGGSFTYQLDNGSKIVVMVKLDRKKREALIDFSGTSKQSEGNYNAPAAISKAAVLYVFRTLIEEDIPLNDGCLRPLRIYIPRRSILSPTYPAAVVAGNTEVSQAIVDALYAALGLLASSQGTMNNLIYGNARYQNYETICGGTGAGENHVGASAIHSHMTNTRMTDLEILEQRFPVRLDSFSIIRGSGGLGKMLGGDGVSRCLTFLERSKLTVLSSRRLVSPYGLCGGGSARCGRNYVLRGASSEKARSREPLDGNDETIMQKGDTFVMETPGGGGYGKLS